MDTSETFIIRYKAPLLALIGAVVLGLFAYGTFKHFQAKRYAQYGDQLFAFRQKEMLQFEKKELKILPLWKRYQEVTSPMGAYPGLASQHLSMADLLLREKLSSEAQALLEKGLQTFDGPLLRYLYATRLAVLHEDKGEYQKAVQYLESLLNSNISFFTDKIYLDLGRLQQLQGNKLRAQASFKWVLEKASEEEFKKMAKLYLSELK